ncbi:MAG TPA: dienelactone hydrolase family protein [Thermomicrobiales bacterium]
MATTVSPPPASPTDENPEVQSLIAAWYAGAIGRRDFLMRATAALGTLAAATTLLEACGGKGATATPFATTAPTTAATRAAASAAAPTTSPSAASPSAATAAPTTAASSAAAATQAPPGTTAAGASAVAGTRPAGSAAASTTTSGSAVAVAGTPVATGVPVDAVNAQMVQFKSGTADIIAYEARPKTGTGPFPGVVVIHENMGLTDHIKDVTRRLAKEGYVGIGVDLLSREGGTMAFSNPQDSTTAIGKLSDDQMLGDVAAAVAYLRGTSVGAPKVGITGFCFGGRIVIISAEKVKGFDAAVAFYGQLSTNNAAGRVDPTKEAASLECPLMGNYGALDALAQGIPAFQDAAKASGKPLDFKVFPDTGHAFNNDTRPFANGFGYVPASAQEAWTRTLAWFKKYLT